MTAVDTVALKVEPRYITLLHCSFVTCICRSTGHARGTREHAGLPRDITPDESALVAGARIHMAHSQLPSPIAL